MTAAVRMSPDPATRRRTLHRLLGHLRDGTTDSTQEIEHFAARDYSEVAIAEAERDRVFGAVPFIAAHESELANAHDFVAVTLPRNEVILTRQSDGSVRAFVNACRHRGAMLVDAESGNCRVFSCPYHRWSYGTDGALRSVPLDNTFGEFDRTEFGLVELPVEVRHGFVWVIDRAGVDIDVGAWLGDETDAILSGYGMDELVSVTPHRFEHPANWKIMQDGFLDNYHVKFAHPTTAGAVLHTNAVALEDFGRHFWFLTARKSLDRFLEQDPGDENVAKDLIESCFVAPNSMFLIHATHIELLTFRPCGADPGRSVMELRILAPKRETIGMSEERWQQLWEKNWNIIISIIHDEDFPILAASQRAMENHDVGPMLLGRNELASHLFRREVRRLLEPRGPDIQRVE